MATLSAQVPEPDVNAMMGLVDPLKNQQVSIEAFPSRGLICLAISSKQPARPRLFKIRSLGGNSSNPGSDSSAFVILAFRGNSALYFADGPGLGSYLATKLQIPMLSSRESLCSSPARTNNPFLSLWRSNLA